jgi:hypothetical protein
LRVIFSGPVPVTVRYRYSSYRFSGGMILIAVENNACAAVSTGMCLTLVLAGSLPRKLSPFQFLDGRIGLGTKPPPQFGQTLPRILSTHAAQNVHSYVQMRASSESGGSGLLQCSQVGLSSSMMIVSCSDVAAQFPYFGILTR